MTARDLVMGAAGGSSGSLPDPQFKNVSLLLSGDGTNGAQNNTFLDSSTNNFTITRNGNTTQGTFSPYGNLWSNYFDGSGDFLDIPTATSAVFGTGDFTIELWFNSSTTANYQWLINPSVVYTTSNYFNLHVEVTTGYVAFGNAVVDWLTGTSNVCDSKWHHIAVSRSGTTARLFVDGIQQASTTLSSSIGINTTTRIGGYYNGNFPMNGYLSNVRIVKGTALYTTTFTPSTTPLTAVSGTSLLTCQSNRFKDNSSNNFTLTVNGNTSVQRFSPFNPTAAYDKTVLGGSAYFDGTGDYLTAAANTAFVFGTGAFTIEAWVYAPTWGSDSFLISNLSVGNTSWCIEVYGGNINFGGWTTNWLSATAPSTNAWHHIAVSRSGTTLSMFVDGVRVATASNSVDLSANNTLVFGDYVPAGGVNLNGYLSNARLVKGTAVYDPTASTCTVPTAPLTAITNTSILCNFTNAGIPDAAMMNDLETVGNAQVSTSVKKYGTGSLAFDGTGDYLVGKNGLDFSFGTGDFTVEAWVNFTSFASGYPQLIAGHTSFAPQFAFTSTTMYLWDAVVATISGSYTWSTGVWYHVAWTRQNGTVRMFVNGTSVYSGTYTQNLSAVDFDIGTYGAGQSNGMFNGYIDDLRITKGYARYTANFTPPAQALPTN